MFLGGGGNDSNSGSQTSPLATINKAIELADASSTIYLSEGTFNGTGNSGITVDKRNANDGTITIVGAGVDKTIIDLNGTQFLKINSASSVALSNLTIMNGYSMYGGAILSQGNFIANSVKFVNDTAFYGGGAIWVTSTYYLENNEFVNCSSANGQANEIGVGSNKNNYGYVTFDDANITENTFTINATVTDDMGTPIHGGQYSIKIDDTVVATNVNSVNGKIQATVSKILENGEHVLSIDSSDLIVKPGTAYVNVSRNFTNYYVSPEGDDENNDGSKEKPFKTIKQAISKGFEEGEYVNVYLLEGNYNGTGNTNVDISSLKSAGIVNIYGIYNKTIIDGLDTTIGFKLGAIDVNFYNVTITRLKSTAATGVITGTGTINFVDSIFEKNNVVILLTAENANLKNVEIKDNQLNPNPKNMINARRTNIAVKSMDNVTFENNKGVGVITVKSQLLNSKFINNDYYSTIVTSREQQGLISVSSGTTLISKNNLFENNTWRAFYINSGTLISENDAFINNSATNGAAIKGSGSIILTKDTFKDNKGTQGQGGAISASCEIYDCTFINNTINGEKDDILATNINIANNLTFVDVNATTFMPELKAIFKSDDLVVSGPKVQFYIDNDYVGEAALTRNNATLSVITSGGIHEISGYVNNNTNVTTGILNITLANASDIELYVSQNGSDVDGNGTFENPFATIKKAYDWGMQQNTYNMCIKIIGTVKGTGNVLLSLKPYMNMTIAGVDKETSIIDAESSKYIMNIEPYDSNLRVAFENLTIINSADSIKVSGKYLTVENCLFNNISGYALTVQKVYDSEVIINSSQFINSSGAYSSGYAKNTYITNSVFADNHISNEKSINKQEFVISIVNSKDDEYDCHLYMENVTFDSTSADEAPLEWNSASNIFLKSVDATILNSEIKNSVNCSAIFVHTANHNKVSVSLINSTLENNYYDFSAEYGSQEQPRPRIELINTTVINGGGVYHPDLRYQNVLWNVVNSTFVNMAKEMIFNGADIKPNNSVYRPVVNITNTLFINNPNGITIVQGNISESSFYNTTLNVAEANYGGSQPASTIVYLDNNYWNDLAPNYNVTTDKYEIHCDKWIVPGLINDNEPGYSQIIQMAYMQFDGENYTAYDTSKMPIFDENYTVKVSDGNITPTEGLLTRDDVLLFNYTVDSLGNKTVTAELTNGLSVDLIVEFYKIETQLNLTLSADEVYLGENLTVNLSLSELINGTADIYFNGALEYTVDIINGEGVLTVLMDKTPRVYEVFANYTGDDYYHSSVNSTTFTVLDNEMNVTVLNNNSHDNVTFDISFNYPANGTVEVTIANETYTAPVEDGKAQLVLDPMDVGEYEALVSYNGVANQTVPFNVTRDKKTSIKAEDVEMYYEDGTRLNVTLIDAYGEALVNESVTLSVDGGNYTETTDDEGIASFAIDLAVGNYTAEVNYLGNTEQDPATANVNIVVLYNSTTIIEAADVEMYYGDVGELNVTLTNAYGDALVNESVTLSVNGTNYTETTDDEGIASFEITDLELGNYTAEIYYLGSDEQDPASTKANITVLFNTATNIKAEDVVVYYGIPGEFNVTLTNAYGDVLVNESVILSVNGTNNTVSTDANGIATFEITDLELGNYTAEVYYLGSADKDPANTTAVITVLPDTTTIISVDDLLMYYKDGSRLYINLSDVRGNPLVNESVIISLNGANYTRATNENGTASIAINLNSGNYTVGLYYNGTETHDAANATALITILPTVNGTDVVKVFRNGTQYYATFLDNKGNYLAEGTNVTFNINGVTYTRQINGSEGRARLNINLAQGDYIITAINPVTGEMAANNITVIPRIVNNNDLVKYYKNDSQYYVTLLGDDGKPVGANETVTFNINGVMYERKTNESGIARLNINLQPGEYVITAMYKDCNVANNITVLPVLKAENVTMVYKDGTQFKASLVDGQGNPLANTNVTFNINGVFYQRTTDSNGVAALNINLMPGEYIITSSYNGTNIANTIKISDK